MSGRARVLVVDDSVVIRKILGEIIAGEEDLELVGVAPTASIALQKIAQVKPDIVLLDVEMPEMDGIEAVRRIRDGWPRLPVIMCSALTERGADVTLRALANGASDYVAKPSNLGSREASIAAFAAEVLPKVNALLGRPSASMSPPAPVAAAQRPRLTRAPVSVLAIGSSTGGPNALSTVFASFPPDLEVPIVLVQHMPPLFTRLLAERLTASSAVPVHEAEPGMPLRPGHAYVAPGDHHMTVRRDGANASLVISQGAPENSCRPAVDVTFRSVAEVYGAGVLAAVLTGMGHDATRGAAAIVERGGAVVVQDRASCVVPSMPGSVADAGLADAVLPLHLLGRELVARVRRGLAVPVSSPRTVAV